jgi:mRNA-degrading endonuclease RelE of RelBE toxin-antitoxin system
MAYRVTLRKRAIKALQNIDEPYYSNIKEATFLDGGFDKPPKGANTYYVFRTAILA